MRKSNFFNKILKNTNRLINNQLEQNLNKLKFANLANIARSNKIILTFVALIILITFYLLQPILYNQTKISKVLNTELIKKLNLDVRFSNKLNYNFFPKPHFTSKSVMLIHENKKIAEIKSLKIFISIDKLFALKNLEIKDVVISNANFNIDKLNNNFFFNLLNNNYLENTLEIKNSNIFYRDSNNDVLFINKISDLKYYFDQKKLKNFLYSENELFNINYKLKVFENKTEKKIISKLNFDLIKLQIENELSYNEDVKKGKMSILFNKFKSNLNYETNGKFFNFIFFDKPEEYTFRYKGKFNIDPFYSNINGKTDELNVLYFVHPNSIITQLLKTEIFNNKNIDFELNINSSKIKNNSNFLNLSLNSKIKEGLIDLDNTSFAWKNYALFKLTDSLVYLKDGELILDSRIEIQLENIGKIYKFLLTPKKYRNEFKVINLNMSYNFDQETINFNDVRIDKKFDQNINKVISDLSIKNENLQNKIYLKKILNKVIKSYSG